MVSLVATEWSCLAVSLVATEWSAQSVGVGGRGLPKSPELDTGLEPVGGGEPIGGGSVVAEEPRGEGEPKGSVAAEVSE